METFSVIRSQSGSTLIQILIGLAIMSVVGFSAAHIAADTKKAEINGDVSNAISQIHLLAIQKSRNITLLKKTLAKAGLDLSTTSDLTLCLGGSGTLCERFNNQDYKSLGDFYESVPAAMSRTIVNTVDYKLVCSNPSSCEILQLRVQTRTNDFHRQTDLRFGGATLVERAALSFACVGDVDNVVTGVDFQTRQAICKGIPISKDCGDGEPVVDLDAGSDPKCANMAKLNCASGMKTVGLVDTQGVCL